MPRKSSNRSSLIDVIYISWVLGVTLGMVTGLVIHAVKWLIRML